MRLIVVRVSDWGYVKNVDGRWKGIGEGDGRGEGRGEEEGHVHMIRMLKFKKK